MELTQEYFNQAIARLATAEELHLVRQDVVSELGAIRTTLEVHTKALDQLLKDRKDREIEAAVAASRMDRLEKWAAEASQKFGIKFEL